MERWYKELYLTNEWDKIMKGKRQGKLVVPCLPLDRYETTLTVAEYPYILEDVNHVDKEYLEKIRNRMLGIPYEIFRTKRCIVREICASDVDRLFEMYEPPEIRLYMSDIQDTKEEELDYIRKYIRYRYDAHHYGVWIIEDIQSHQVIGRAGLNYQKGRENPELSYLICVERQREGLGYEVCSAILKYARETLGFHCVLARVRAGNTASMHLIHKLGFHETNREGTDEDPSQIVHFSWNQ